MRLANALHITPISTHALREEGDQARRVAKGEILHFYPRPPRGGRRRRPGRPRGPASISTHALREEGDAPKDLPQNLPFAFLPTPSARRATVTVHHPAPISANFYPRPPRGGRHDRPERRTAPPVISTHALREEGDDNCKKGIMRKAIFLPTPSARRATLVISAIFLAL